MAKPTHFGEIMWYVVQTETGKEADLVKLVKMVVHPSAYEKCFSIKREAVWRLKGACIRRTERMFPGYVFAITDTPLEFFKQLKRFPLYSKILGWEDPEFTAVSDEEEQFLKSLLDEDAEDTVRLSPVITDKEGNIRRYGGVLEQYSPLIVKKRIRLRYVLIRKEILGRVREIYIGIRLCGDAGESMEEFLKLFSGGKPERIGADRFAPAVPGPMLQEGLGMGAKVLILDGPLAGIEGTVKEVDDHGKKAVIEVEMFGRATLVYADGDVKLEVLDSGIPNGR